MKLFVRFAIGTLAVVIGLSARHSVYWIEASEHDDTMIAQSALEDCQNCRVADDSWADSDTPASKMFPTAAAIVPKRSAFEHWQWRGVPRDWRGMPLYVGSYFDRPQNEAFAEFHKMFQAELRPYEGEFDPFGWGSRRMFDSANIRSLNGNLMNWYVVQWSRATWIMPKPYFSDHEFESIKVDLISKRSPLLRYKKPNTSKNTEILANPDEDIELSTVTSDPLARLLEVSCEPATRTEWKVTRVQLIALMKNTAPGPDNYHCTPRVGEARESSTDTMSSFEQRGVDQLQSNLNEKVVTTSTDGEIQVVGALRADRQCQHCHKVDSGVLLGVFSYRLKRADPTSSFP